MHKNWKSILQSLFISQKSASKCFLYSKIITCIFYTHPNFIFKIYKKCSHFSCKLYVFHIQTKSPQPVETIVLKTRTISVHFQSKLRLTELRIENAKVISPHLHEVSILRSGLLVDHFHYYIVIKLYKLTFSNETKIHLTTYINIKTYDY